MYKNKWMAFLLTAAAAASSMGSLSAAAAEEANVVETETVLEVTSVEEAVAALDSMTEPVESETVVTTTTAEETTTETTTTTTTSQEVMLAQETIPSVTTTTSVMMDDPVVTTVMTGEEQGSAPVNYYDDVVLLLDISGSMYGEPMDAMKLAATEICKSFLQNNPTTAISVVAFGSNVEYLPYSSDLTTLTAYISELSTKGLTNMYGGMEQVKLILNSSNGEKKSVIIMADGMPNSDDYNYTIDYGYDPEQNAALQFDNENLKTDATVYSIGFFHDYYSDENAAFIRDLASDAMYSYIVTDSDDLDDAFQMVFQQIVTEDPKKPAGKVEGPVTDAPVDGTTSTPKTADKGLGVIVGIMAVAGLGIVLGKRK